MRKHFFMIIVLLTSTMIITAQTKVNPIIKSYGAVFPIPDADHKPDPKIKYKILIELTENSTKPDTLNIFLEAVATLINMHGAEGVQAKNLQVTVVLRKLATNAMFSNEYYNQKFSSDNPNLQLIKELHDAGVEFYVCGQTLMRARIDKSKLVPEAKVASASLTVMTELQMKGYAFIKF